jgi:predicted permease
MTGAVVLVLFIAVANAASLVLTRAAAVEHEMALRAALGAGVGVLLRYRLLESAVLASGVGVAGVGGGLALTQWLVTNAPARLPRTDAAGLGTPAVLIGLGVMLAVTAVLALAPLLIASGTASAVVSRTRATSGRNLIRIRETLVVADVALALTLGVGAAVMVRSVDRLLAVDPGFTATDVFTAQVSLVGQRWATDDPVRVFQRELLERVKALPGVSDAALTGQVPLGGNYDRRSGYLEERQTGRDEDEVEFERYSISPTYLRVMGIPLLKGRALGDHDRTDAPGVMLVSETAARQHWPGQNPLGRKVIFDPKAPPITVVGVVGDVRHYRLEDPPAPQMYRPQEQLTDSFLVLTVKGAGFDKHWPSVRQIVRELGPDVPMYAIESMPELVSKSAAPRRFTTFVLGLFAVLAIAMTAAGVYGLVAYTVAHRTREIGIRLALGATPAAIRRLVLKRGFALTVLGVAAGLGSWALVGRALSGIRYETAVLDSGAVLAASAILAFVTLLAHAAPLRRAVRISPTETLRSE